MSENPDVLRLRTENGERARHFETSDRYPHFNLAQLFIIQKRQRDVLKCLQRNGFYPLGARRILEVGCGAGGVLLETLSHGASATNLCGADLLLDRLQAARHAMANVPLINTDGQNLPYATHSFDLSMQFTAFSSILDDEVKVNVAHEMLRVTRLDGLILWYDFWLNPTNPRTRGIRPTEIKRLFPNCRYKFQRITLAPPITRRLVSISWAMCLFLENLKIFNTHYLAAIRPLSTSTY